MFPTSPTIESYLRHGGMASADETADNMVSRVVTALGSVDRHFTGSTPQDSDDFEERLGQELDAGRIVLSPTIMANAGRGAPRPLATCAAPPVNLRSELRTIQAVVDRYHQAGMGTGFNLDGLEDPLAMLQYLNYVAAVGPGLGGARGAMLTGRTSADPNAGTLLAGSSRPLVGNIALLSLSHPRAEDFVASKVAADTEGEVWQFNIALRVSDTEMKAALRSDDRERALLLAAARAAHDCAEPALIFADRMEETNPTPLLGPYTSTGPSAEVGLLTGETCVFGQVNLGRFHRTTPRPAAEVWRGRGLSVPPLTTGAGAGGTLPVDFDGLAEAIYALVRALDDAVEIGLALHPTVLSSELTRANRKIGVGVCGLADLLGAAGVAYDSLQGQVIAQEALAYLHYVAKLASVELAVRRGPCPAVRRGRSRYADPDYLRRFTTVDVRSVTPGDWAALADRVAESGLLRNTTCTAIPPTPHSGPLIGAYAGIDPPDSARANPTSHLTMAAAAQSCVDEAVSTTIHLPSGTNAEDVYDTYVAAWELRCKSVAVAVDS
jgi:ribonucleoside-diphosphate reductase alpha chain